MSYIAIAKNENMNIYITLAEIPIYVDMEIR